MRAFFTTSILLLAVACGPNSIGDDTPGDDGGGGKKDDCVGLECHIVNCGAMSLPPTTISGTVYAPNGTLPLHGVNVYIPRTELTPIVEGVSCERCQSTLDGNPLVQVTSG